MKLSQNSIEKLKNAASINKSLIFREGSKIRTMDDNEAIFAIATLEDRFPRQFGIHDLNQFLSAHSLMKEPEIEFEEDHISMTSDGAKLKFFYANERHLPTPPGDNINLPKSVMKFKLEKGVLETLLKACAVMKISTMYISENGIICRNPDDDGHEYKPSIGSIDVDQDMDLTGKVYCLELEALKIIPNTYDVVVTPVAIRMTSESGDIEYVVMLNSSK